MISRRDTSPSASVRWTASKSILIMLLTVGLLAGCDLRNELPIEYGRRRGDGNHSVNGTSLLADMFDEAGFEVTNWRRLSPRLDRQDVIVWVPNRFQAPYPEEVEFLSDWLSESSGRTLIYVGRDYDAAIDYWREIMPKLPPPQITAARHELARLRATLSNQRSLNHEIARCDWFVIDPNFSPQRITHIDGPWAAIGEPDAISIYQHTRLTYPPQGRDKTTDDEAGDEAEAKTGAEADGKKVDTDATTDDAAQPEIDEEDEEPFGDADLPDADESKSDSADGDRSDNEASDSNDEAELNDEEEASDDESSEDDATWPRVVVEPLLQSGDISLATRIVEPSWQGSQLIVINNGSWLLNLPLLRNSHRQIAEQMIAACGSSERVCFLECDRVPMTISDSDTELPLMVKALTVWPVNLVVAHLLFVGLVYCFAMFPIFGKPQQLVDEHVSDFGKHVHAFGELLEREQDDEYAQRQLRYGREWMSMASETRKPRSNPRDPKEQ